MIRINNGLTLKQYNSPEDKMSNSIKENTGQYKNNSLTIEQLLHNLKLNNNHNNQLILMELLQNNIPLKKQLFVDINQFLNEIKDHSEQNLQNKIKIALVLKKLNLPLNSKFFNLFKNTLKLKDKISDELNRLISPKEVKQNNNSNNNKTLATSLKDLNISNNKKIQEIIKQSLALEIKLNQEEIAKINSTISKNDIPFRKIKNILLLKKLELPVNNKDLNTFILTLDLTKEDNLTPTLKKLLKTLSIESNSKISTLILPKLKKIIANNPKSFIEIKESLSKMEFKNLEQKLRLPTIEKNKILKDIIKKELANNIIMPNNITEEQIQKSLNTLNSSNSKQDTLLKALFYLKENNLSEEVTIEDSKILKELIANKLINYNNNPISLFLPLLVGDNIKLATIKLNQDQEKNKQNKKEKDLNFSFAIDTNKLGYIEIKIKIKNNKISGLFNTTHSKTFRLINQYLNKFKTRFQDTEYQIDYLTCKLIEENATEQKEEKIKLKNVDFKA
ncbi:flagellar hook-length control protein FliK [Orenia marismortui]|uniref:Flagellar hook-length control protein FliK n=1 Tax=Orenia marismortui TaxID=46469 RepID=A0A4R8H0B2_9FIRM|nr:flagellar hook-length control protein FliK [Orenia marismortui]TDX52756.1 flagellar hook-length control protein FliK [Orenia marismortui]